MDKKGIESFTLAQLSKLIKRNNPTGLDDDFIIIGENLPNTELFKYPCRVDALVAVICLEGELICNINLKEYRITTNMMIINTPENIIQVKDIGNRKFYGIAVSSAFFEQSFLDARDMIPLYMQIQKEPCFHLSNEDTDIFCQFISLMQLICHTQDTPKKTATLLRLGSALMYKIHDTILAHDSPSKNEIKMSRQEICIGKAARSNRTRPGRENTLDNGEEDFHAPAVCRHWQDCDGRILSQQNKSLKVAGLNGCNTW